MVMDEIDERGGGNGHTTSGIMEVAMVGVV